MPISIQNVNRFPCQIYLSRKLFKLAIFYIHEMIKFEMIFIKGVCLLSVYYSDSIVDKYYHYVYNQCML